MDTETQSPTSTQSTKIWVFLGRLAVIVGLIWGIIQLATWIRPSGPKLEARCKEFEFAQAPDIEKMLRAFRFFPNNQLLSFALSNAIGSFETNLDIGLIADWLERKISDAKSRESDFDYDRWERFTTLTIRNNGNKSADQVVLPLNKEYKGIALVTYDGKTKIEAAHGSLDLGSLKPDGEIIIKMWSVAPLLPYGNKAVISHSGGTTPIERPKLLYGYGGSLGSFSNDFFEHPFFYILGVLFLAFFWIIFLAVTNRLWGEENGTPTPDSVNKPPQNPQA